MRAARRDMLVIVAILALIAVVGYAAVLVGGATFVGRDHLTHTIPAKQYLADALQDGRLPEWWSAVDLGVPFAANPNHSALYPPVWLVALLPMPWSVDVLLVLHVLFAGVGTAVLARRFGARPTGAIVAGAAFMLCGFTSSTLVHGGPLLTLAWAPWIASFADDVATAQTRADRTRTLLVLAAVIACELLAGDPSFAIAGGLLSLGVAVCRADRRLLAAAIVILAHVVATVLAAVVVAPALLFALESSRGSGLAYETATAWSMHPLRALEWIWPDALGDPNRVTAHVARAIADSSRPMRLSPSWALGLYLSIPVLVLAAAGWLRGTPTQRRLGWVVLGFILLALGRYTPVYDAFRTVFVVEKIVRYPEKYLSGAVVITCAFAGLGWTTFADRDVARRTWMIVASTLGALVIAIGVGLWLVPHLAHSADLSTLAPTLDIDAGRDHARDTALTAVTVTCAIAALCYLSRYRRWLLHVGSAILIAHLVARVWQLLPTFDRAILERAPAIIENVTAAHRIARPMSHRMRADDELAAQARTLYEGAAPNVATRFGQSYFIGYDQGHNARFHTWRPTLVANESRAHDVYGVELEIIDADDAGRRPVLGTDAPYGPYALVANVDHRPRAFTTNRWRWFADDTTLASELFAAGSDPTTTLATVHLSGEGPAASVSAPLVAECTIASSRPEAVDVTCDARADGYAVLLDTWAPGWTASVDGTPTQIERGDLLVRAVRVSAGRHTIAYRYVTPGLRTGAVISLAAWLGWLGLLAALHVGKGRRAPLD